MHATRRLTLPLLPQRLALRLVEVVVLAAPVPVRGARSLLDQTRWSAIPLVKANSVGRRTISSLSRRRTFSTLGINTNNTTTTTAAGCHGRNHRHRPFSLLPPSTAVGTFSFSSSSFLSSSSSGRKDNDDDGVRRRSDPFTRRPTAKCDPYGQGGKPLTLGEAQDLLRTVDPEWRLVISDDDDDDDNGGGIKKKQKMGEDDSTTNNNNNDGDDDPENVQEGRDITVQDAAAPATITANVIIPFALTRDFVHHDYLGGGQFISQVVTAVAEMNGHYPYRCILRRQIVKKKKKTTSTTKEKDGLAKSSSSSQRLERGWQVITTVTCRTDVLRGLSHHDFYLATMIDVELDRPNIRDLVKQGTQ